MRSHTASMPFSLDPDRVPHRKHMGAILGLFDSPPHRDWLVWWTGFWFLISILAIGFPSPDSVRTSDLPRWLDATLAAIFFTAVFGVLPAYIRVRIRRRLLARKSRARGGEHQNVPPAAEAVPPQPERQHAGTPGAPAAKSRPRASQPQPPVTSQKAESEVLPDLRTDAVLARAAEGLPYPVARAVRRLQQANTPRDTYEATLRAGEMLSIVIGISAVAWAVSCGRQIPGIDTLLAAFSKGVAQGAWLQAAQSVERPLAEDGGFPGLAATLGRTKGSTAVLDDLKLITEERNAWAHGASPRSQPEAADRTATILPALLRALERAQPLAAHDWLMVEGVRLIRQTGRFELSAARAMGAHPDWHRCYVDSESATPDDCFYIQTPDGLIDLLPFVVMRKCPRCNQPELAYADRIDRKRGVALKSFDSGHPFFDNSLTPDLLVLLGPTAGSPPPKA